MTVEMEASQTPEDQASEFARQLTSSMKALEMTAGMLSYLTKIGDFQVWSAVTGNNVISDAHRLKIMEVINRKKSELKDREIEAIATERMELAKKHGGDAWI